MDVTFLRRLALFMTLMFWQGGFMFYGGVVVPVGTAVLGSDADQGFITRSVTNYLNLAGAVALAVWAWDIASGPRAGRSLRGSLWCVLAATLGLLAVLHVRMDGYLDAEAMRVLDRPAFRVLHHWYLTTSTAQWVVCILLAGATIHAWRFGDEVGCEVGRIPPDADTRRVGR